MAKLQWLKSWRIKGSNNTPDKRITLMLSDYDYLIKMETLGSENKYVEDATLLIPSSSDNVQKLTHGFFYKAQMLKSKTYTAAGKTPDPVLIDYTLPIFTKDTVEMLRLFSVNREANGKYVRRTFIAIYHFDSYQDFKDVMQKSHDNKTGLRSIPEAKKKASIELSTMPATGGTFVSSDVMLIDDIASVLAATEAAKATVILKNHFDKLEEAKDNSPQGSYESKPKPEPAPSTDIENEFASTAPAPADDDEFPF